MSQGDILAWFEKVPPGWYISVDIARSMGCNTSKISAILARLSEIGDLEREKLPGNWYKYRLRRKQSLIDYVSGNRNFRRRHNENWDAIRNELRKNPGTPAQIAERLGWPIAQVENRLQRMRKAGEVELKHYWIAKKKE